MSDKLKWLLMVTQFDLADSPAFFQAHTTFGILDLKQKQTSVRLQRLVYNPIKKDIERRSKEECIRFP